MAVKTADRSLRQQEPLDFTSASFLALILAVIVLFAFIFLPWMWTEAKYNGARLMSDVLVAGSLKNFGTIQLVIIPVAALAAGGLALWNLLGGREGPRASLLILLCSALGLYYYADLYFIRSGEVAEYIRANTGTGFKVTFVALVGLAAQAILTIPQANYIWQRAGERLSSRRPSVSQKAVPYLFLAGPLALYIVWVLAPTVYTFYLSLTNWDGVTTPVYVGLKNYETLFKQSAFTESLSNNVRWLAIFITIPTTLGLGLAMIFNTDMRGGNWYKVSFYSPLVLSWPVIALVWIWVYHPANGLINSLLTGIGITDNPPGWLADRNLAIYCIIAAATWRQAGYVMVLYLAGLKNLDPALLDAGLVDGANRWQLFRHVIFPLLAPVTTIVFIISVIDSLRSFDLVQVMTRGHQATQVLANYMYIEAFNNYRMGFGGAIAVVLFSISLVFVGLYLWVSLKDELEY
ncbi:carbohydrate ABC transporter permease [Aggregatilinea lenta]|uniref:carbohydrate ABC transporter permease n=1 Tax=Aggregatilinea lenta TaxID=913108 RepID=UPI001EE847A0|nr:sugar ABC transporter permease [Aggregatilinea lenta]